VELVTRCPSPGCERPLEHEEHIPYLRCDMHGPMIPVCMECGAQDGRTAAGGLLCHDCKENE